MSKINIRQDEVEGEQESAESEKVQTPVVEKEVEQIFDVKMDDSFLEMEKQIMYNKQDFEIEEDKTPKPQE